VEHLTPKQNKMLKMSHIYVYVMCAVMLEIIHFQFPPHQKFAIISEGCRGKYEKISHMERQKLSHLK
jgi:hypothetical protein